MASPTDFRSAYGPKYQFQLNIRGLNGTAMYRLGLRSAFFGGAAGLAALFLVSGIPRVRMDILQKLPYAGNMFIKEPVNPADNNVASSGDKFWPPKRHIMMTGQLITLTCTILITLLVHATVLHNKPVFSSALTLALLLGALPVMACVAWLGAVSSAVPEPYLDEVFHVPQAQRYCLGKFGEWDEKITTPPGLYLFSIFLPWGLGVAGLDWTSFCGTGSLRAVNVVALIVLAYLFLLCRLRIEAGAYQTTPITQPGNVSWFSAHSACNAALFPVIFFFSGLYYTDVLSTTLVLGAFLNHLDRVGRVCHSAWSDMSTVTLGTLALLMRQTNIFWIVAYMGGLEAVHAAKSRESKKGVFSREQLESLVYRFAAGDVHDPPLSLSSLDDSLLTAVGVAIAVLCTPRGVLRQTWPYLVVLVFFVVFVVWNGGVVLGDKSNHVATIHLAQMLYIWPLFTFFSLPLVLPQISAMAKALTTALGGSGFPRNCASSLDGGSGTLGASSENEKRPSEEKSEDSEANPSSKCQNCPPSEILSMANCRGLMGWTVYLAGNVGLSLLVVRYSTIIHPFTLADNRHYMFYVFRYTIRRASWVRYLLVVPYVICQWMVWATLAGWTGDGLERRWPDGRAVLRGSPTSSPDLQAAYGGGKGVTQTRAPPDEVTARRIDNSGLRTRELVGADLPGWSTAAPRTSTALFLLLATALSLVTAPLVEPRYFIVPWIMWRLLIPERRRVEDDGPPIRPTAMRRRHDVRLMAETAWFLVVNAATCYVFLARPFVWKAEDGAVLDQGRRQRFMW